MTNLSSNSQHQRAELTATAFALAVPLMLLASVFRGGNRYLPLLLLEVLAAALLLGLAWQPSQGGRPRGLPGALGRGWRMMGLVALLGAPLWAALLHLVPLPEGVWAALPGRADYLGRPGTEAPAGLWRAASLSPETTLAAVLAGVPVVACLALALLASARQIETLCRLWTGVAVAQAVLGLMQLGPSNGLYFGLDSSELVGSFASKNTYSNFLVMAIPLVVWEMGERSGQEGGRRQPNWLWGIALFVLLSTLLAATSRAGIATGVLVAMLAVALLPARGARRWAGMPWAFWGMAALIALALAAGGLAWLDRFEADQLVADDATRALMREGTWQGIMAFWPLGSGLGTYASVFPRFQAPELGNYLIDLAHSDYLQLLMELGALGLALMAVLFALLMRRAVQLARAGRRGWQPGDALAVAAGLGALAFGLHAWVDYPMRIPANAMFAAFLVGVMLRTTYDDRAGGTS